MIIDIVPVHRERQTVRYPIARRRCRLGAFGRRYPRSAGPDVPTFPGTGTRRHPRLRRRRSQRTLSDVARATGLTRATARPFRWTLTELGYVRAEGGVFSLRPRVLDLGQAFLSFGMTDVARDCLQSLAARLGESASLAVLDGHEVVRVAQAEPARLLAPAQTVGARLPAHVTSAGRVLLAGLPSADQQQYFRSPSFTAESGTSRAAVRAALADVAERGHAIVDQELGERTWSVSAPVRAREGKATAAVTASLHGRWSADRIAREVVPAAMAAAEEIARGASSRQGRAPMSLGRAAAPRTV